MQTLVCARLLDIHTKKNMCGGQSEVWLSSVIVAYKWEVISMRLASRTPTGLKGHIRNAILHTDSSIQMSLGEAKHT